MSDLPFQLLIESEMEKYRAESFWTKEPETIEWIKSFVKDGDIFWDIGANIGIYSLYISKLYPNSQVWAFEPQFGNYFRLIQNVSLNRFTNIFPFFIGFSNKTKLTQFYSKKEDFGSSGGQIDSPIDENKNSFEPKSVLPILVYRIEEFINKFLLNIPNHIKIDVDGHEMEILSGLHPILIESKLKSILIEFNSDCDYWIWQLKFFGFTVDNDFNKISNHSKHRRKNENIKAENMIFIRR